MKANHTKSTVMSEFDRCKIAIVQKVKEFSESEKTVDFRELYIKLGKARASGKLQPGELQDISSVIEEAQEKLDGWSTLRDSRGDELPAQDQSKIPKTLEERKEAVRKFLNDGEIQKVLGGPQFQALKESVNPNEHSKTPHPTQNIPQKKKNKIVVKLEKVGSAIKSFVSKYKNGRSNNQQGQLR